MREGKGGGRRGGGVGVGIVRFAHCFAIMPSLGGCHEGLECWGGCKTLLSLFLDLNFGYGVLELGFYERDG